MMASTRFFEHTDRLWLFVRVVLVGVAIALALAPSWAGSAQDAPVGPTRTGVVAWVMSTPALPPAEPPPGAPPPDYVPGYDCALAPAGFLAA